MPRGGRRSRSGPPPKPTALRILEGNPSRRPLNLEREPRPAAAIPPCPRQLGKLARKEWRRIAPELYRLGLLTEIDRAALAGYCASYGRFIEAEVAVRNAGDSNDIAPLVRTSKTALDQMHRYLIEFGMAPSARARILTPTARAQFEHTTAMQEDELFLSGPILKLID
jgi:P27 family predicted phage terminase small subunit